MLDDIVNKYNNKVDKTIKMNPVDVTSDSFAQYNEDSKEKDPRFKVLWSCQNIKMQKHFC